MKQPIVGWKFSFKSQQAGKKMKWRRRKIFLWYKILKICEFVRRDSFDVELTRKTENAKLKFASMRGFSVLYFLTIPEVPRSGQVKRSRGSNVSTFNGRGVINQLYQLSINLSLLLSLGPKASSRKKYRNCCLLSCLLIYTSNI